LITFIVICQALVLYFTIKGVTQTAMRATRQYGSIAFAVMSFVVIIMVGVPFVYMLGWVLLPAYGFGSRGC
jgi:Mg2+/Co2+ transporter CorB